MLLAECEAGQVTRWQPCAIQGLKGPQEAGGNYELQSDRGLITAPQVVIATGGLSIPEDRRHRFRLPHRQTVRPAPGGAARRAGAADL